MRDFDVVATVFLAPYCVNGSTGIWYRAGLEIHSFRPKNSPLTKTSAGKVALILELRSRRNLGARRIQSELKLIYSISLAMATIDKVLCQNQVKPVVTFRHKTNFLREEALLLVIGSIWITVKLALAYIGTLLLKIVLAIKSWGSTFVAWLQVDCILLIFLLKKCISRCRSFRLIREESFLSLRYRKNWKNEALSFI